jgi:hypothetical protein
MDFLSDNFVFAVFIVLAIALQIGRLFIRKAQRRRREDRGEAEEGRMEAPADKDKDKYEEYERYEEDEDEDGAFSAWNLSVDDETVPVIPPPAAAPRPVSVPFSAPLSVPVPEASPFPALIADSALGAERREPAAPFFSPVPEAGPLAEDRRKGESGGRSRDRAKRSAGFPEKLDYLPPLKRAVVLAELLGAPKGF